MEPYLAITEYPSALKRSLSMLNEVGLSGVPVEGDGRLKVIGGSEIKNAEFGYEISEPEFSIFLHNTDWIAVIQDMASVEDRNISHKCTSLEAAVDFICTIYISSLAKVTNKKSQAV